MKAEDLDSAIQKTANYLYKIEGEVIFEQYQAISKLRQLINEEFVGKDKQVSNQLIYDILKEIDMSMSDQARNDIIAAIANDTYEQLKNDQPYINLKFEEMGAVCRDIANRELDEYDTEVLKRGFYAGQAMAGVELEDCHANYKKWANPTQS